MNIGLRGFFWTGVKDCDCFSFGSKFSYPHYEHYRFSKGVISKLQIVQWIDNSFGEIVHYREIIWANNTGIDNLYVAN